jgi:hypothetical protein
MDKPTYIEDIFLEFHNRLVSVTTVSQQDILASASFYNLISAGNNVTESQSRFMLKLLEKYKTYVSSLEFNYKENLVKPEWRQPFRILDDTKKIYIEIDNAGKQWICLKHPFALKDKFNKEVQPSLTDDRSFWDPEQRVRKFSIYDINLILLQKFISDNGFIIDNTFLDYAATVEEIWQESVNFLPYCMVSDNEVVLKNSNESTQTYFEKNKKENIFDNLLLAKNLGFRLEKITKPENLVEKIASEHATKFWLKDIEKFFTIYKNISGVVCVIVDDNADPQAWIEKFIDTSKKNDVNSEEIRVCFRTRNDENPKFNDWIKNNNLGGPIDNARLLIFKNKPPKWLFKDKIDVKIIVVNKPFPPSSIITQSWISNHPCVIYLDKLRPSITKEKNIVDL